MIYILIGIAGVVGGVLLMLIAAAITSKKERKRQDRHDKKGNKRKLEFSKILIALVLFTYFIGVFVGIKIVFIDFSGLSVLLTFIGTPTATAIIFYCWKAKAENIVKIKKENPKETEGIPVDLNNISGT